MTSKIRKDLFCFSCTFLVMNQLSCLMDRVIKTKILIFLKSIIYSLILSEVRQGRDIKWQKKMDTKLQAIPFT